MKHLFILACMLVSIGQTLAASMPVMMQIRVYNDHRQYINDYTGASLTKSQIVRDHSTIYDFANIVEIDSRDNTVVKLFRVYPRVPKTQVGSVNFLTAQQAQNFHNRLAAGQVRALTFPTDEMESGLLVDAEQVIVSFR